MNRSISLKIHRRRLHCSSWGLCRWRVLPIFLAHPNTSIGFLPFSFALLLSFFSLSVPLSLSLSRSIFVFRSVSLLSAHFFLHKVLLKIHRCGADWLLEIFQITIFKEKMTWIGRRCTTCYQGGTLPSYHSRQLSEYFLSKYFNSFLSLHRTLEAIQKQINVVISGPCMNSVTISKIRVLTNNPECD